MKRITVLLADDNRDVRREFRKILELEDDLEVVGEAKDGHKAVALAKKLHPALVLMDITMPLLNGLRATCQILKAVPASKVLMLSTHSDEAYIIEAVNSGAMGQGMSTEETCRHRTLIPRTHNRRSPTINCRIVPVISLIGTATMKQRKSGGGEGRVAPLEVPVVENWPPIKKG